VHSLSATDEREAALVARIDLSGRTSTGAEQYAK
jgi:hypothetical protein